MYLWHVKRKNLLKLQKKKSRLSQKAIRRERNILENEAISRAGGEDKAENVMGEELFDKVEKKSKKKKE